MNLKYILIALFLSFCLFSNAHAINDAPRNDAEKLKEMREKIRSHRGPGVDITKDFEGRTMAAAGKGERPARESTEKMIRDINQRRDRLKQRN